MPESEKLQMPSILKTILNVNAVRLEEQKHLLPRWELEQLCKDLPPPRQFRTALDPAANTTGPADNNAVTEPPAFRRAASVSIIAEVKRRSPSRGVIRRDFDLTAIHKAYQRGGADAYSVLTEKDHFGGSLADLKALRALTAVPILRKDFLFDPYQIYEARSAGADAVLLIVAALEEHQLTELIELSRELGLEALVEVHSARELERALACDARIVGINNRDLHSFEVDLSKSLQLARQIPTNITVVSESGIHGPEDIRRLTEAGIRIFLVGEHLMQSQDPATALRRLKEAL
jgi:indole-3-glycerol phosphate synthase